MAIIIKFKEGRKEVWHLEALEDLCSDIKRSLVIQFTGFIDKIEDCEVEAASIGSVDDVRFLYDCYQAA